MNDEINITTTTQKTVVCKVVGFFDLQVASLNQSWGLMELTSVEEIFDAEDSITAIELQIEEDSIFLADEITVAITEALDDDTLLVENWKAQNKSLLSGLQGQSISSYMIQVFVMISVILGIAISVSPVVARVRSLILSELLIKQLPVMC